jgi:superfamily II DNA helicase RecQ
MQIKFFQIPCTQSDEAESALNRFLGSHKVLRIDKHLVSDCANSFWALSVDYLGKTSADIHGKGPDFKKNRIDYKEVLSDEDFKIFSRLREVRKELAQRDGVPVFAVFTNEQLAAMVQKKVKGKVEMQQIEGIGKSKMDRWADDMLKVLTRDEIQ